MKCPKCGYLGFEHVERCRNCGYEFSLSPALAMPELPMRHEATEPNPLDDLMLVDRTPPVDAERFASEMDQDLDRLLAMTDPLPAQLAMAAAPAAPAPAARALHAVAAGGAARRAAAAERLPLFGSTADDVPLITRASPPRQPLAVRRATPEVQRMRAEPARTASFDLPLDLGPAAPAGGGRHAAARSNGATWGTPAGELVVETAGLTARMAAVAIDLLILATIDAAVVYFTMQICGVGVEELAIVPKGPLVAFLLVQNGGYLVAFTVGGQTLGKMAAGIRVVPAEPDANLDIPRALLRTILWLVLAVPAGLGFLSAVFSRDHRGLHDRLARTRVVRASA
ncbi:MAG: RDD family protein [Acidobacteria bacterium]|nr:RDD family protein [Acidobacteriota bacterium]